MSYSRHIMVTTRAFIGALSRTVLPRPRLYSTAAKLFFNTRARNRYGALKYFPSGRYLSFRIETQYGKEITTKTELRRDILHYLEWVKDYNELIR